MQPTAVRLLAVAGVSLISFSAVFVRLADSAPITAAFFRAAYALPALTVLWWWQRGRDHRSSRERLLAFVAGVFLAVDMAFWHRAIGLIGAGLATVLGNTQVLFVGIAAWLWHRERPTRTARWMVPVVFTGVVLTSGLGRPEAYGSRPALGVVYGVLTGLTYCVYLLLIRRSNRSLAPASGPLLDATAGAAVAALVLGAVDGQLDLVWHWPSHGWLLALALVSQVVGWLLIQTALPRLPALETSVLLLLQPLLTVQWGFLLFAEHLSALQWTGVALVLGGVGYLSLRGSVEKPPDAEPELAGVRSAA